MALVRCPECRLPASTGDITCPHCGSPLDAIERFEGFEPAEVLSIDRTRRRPPPAPASNQAPPGILRHRHAFIAELKKFGREMLGGQGLAPDQLAKALIDLAKQHYRGDVLAFLARWVRRNESRSEEAARARSRMFESVRSAAVRYVREDEALWREEGDPYPPGSVETILDVIGQAGSGAEMCLRLEQWFETS